MINSRPQKILIVDEINYTRLVLNQALANNGYSVDTARNSGEAMQLISAELPDVILFSLPGTSSGVSALRSLKDYFRLRLDIAQGAEPAIIILSDFRNVKQIREVQTLGVSRSLSRPVNIQELFDSVSSVISDNRETTLEKRMKIILFDSETRSQKFLESILVHEMYDIESPESEAEFLASIRKGEYDLSIIDLMSFESEIAAVMKSIAETAKEMPVMTIATSADQISQDELKEFGVHIHFVKPIHVDVFRTEVDALLQQHIEPLEEQEESQEDQEKPQEATAENTDQDLDDEKI